MATKGVTEILKLVRISYSGEGTFGVLLAGGGGPHYDDIPFCVTLERPWRNNAVGVSCIPVGNYICKRVASPKFGNTFEITNVPGRTHILFHAGNLVDDTHGCVITGEEFGILAGQSAVLSSGKAFREFMSKLKDTDKFALIIKEAT